MTIQIVTAPEEAAPLNDSVSIFLGGSIEAGKAALWQDELIEFLCNQVVEDIQIFNPRRRQWDVTWPFNAAEHPELKHQITWELEHQDKADILIYYFAADTISPITLFELGIYAQRQPIIFVQKEYLRFANVKITADHFGWTYFTDESAFREAIIEKIKTERRKM